jgi:hypothetical protein
MKVTIFKDILETKNPFYVEIDKIVDRIRDGNSRELVNKIRQSFTKEDRTEIKKKLPSICFSGIFTQRSNNAIKEHSGLVCIDFDHLENVQEFKDMIIKDTHIMIAFVSPSGDGLKVVVKIPANINTHKGSCKALNNYFKNDKLDNFEDIARVCFESYDKDIYYNKYSVLFDKIIHDEVVTSKKIEHNTDGIDIFNKLKTWIEKSESYTDGNKHKFLVKFSGSLNRFGVNQYEAINLLISHYKYAASEVKEKDFETIVRNVYRNYSGQFNTEFFEKTGIAYNRVTRIETAKDFYNEFSEENKTTTLKNKLLNHLITFDNYIPKPPAILSIRNEFDFREIPIMTLGNISVIKGKAKSKKTYLVKIFGATLLKNFEIFRNIYPSLPEDKRNVVIIDTEQSKYDTSRLTHQIITLSKTNDTYLSVFNFRGLSSKELKELIKFIVETFSNIGIIFLDQVADLVRSLNSEEEAVDTVKFLELISAEKNIHICGIVHINKQDNFAQGWLGTQLMKKAETIINVSKNPKFSKFGIVEPDLTRGEEFEPFIFSINEHGLPELTPHSTYDEMKRETTI